MRKGKSYGGHDDLNLLIISYLILIMMFHILEQAAMTPGFWA